MGEGSQWSAGAEKGAMRTQETQDATAEKATLVEILFLLGICFIGPPIDGDRPARIEPSPMPVLPETWRVSVRRSVAATLYPPTTSCLMYEFLKYGIEVVIVRDVFVRARKLGKGGG